MPTVQIDGGALAYAETGAGTPVILIHSFPHDSRIWTGVLRELKSAARLIAPDTPGFGQSPPTGALSIGGIAEVVKRLIDALGLGPVVLGGVSMGGYVALAFAEQYPRLLKGLILCDTKAEADAPDARAGRNRMIELVRAEGPAAMAARLAPQQLSPATLRDHPAVVDQVKAIMESQSAAAIEQALTALRDRPSYQPVLATIQMPALVIVGAADQITPPAGAQKLAAAIKGSRVEVIDGAGHLSPIERPVAVAGVVRKLIEKIG